MGDCVYRRRELGDVLRTPREDVSADLGLEER